MKLYRFFKKFLKDNKTEYFISLGVLSLGSLLIYSIQHSRSLFNLSEFLMWLPGVWFIFSIMSFVLGLFLFWRDFE